MDTAREQPKILLVEDDLSVGAATQELVGQLGYDVHWVSSSNEAFYEIARCGYRAVLLDLKLGADDGVELVLNLRAAGRSVPPIIIVSAQTLGNLREAATKTGAVEVIRKPFAVASLKAALTRTMTLRT